ncbi:MAG: phosphatidylserine/phosphatidylglycerophosphate/cardiolipin synthase family protein [Candidatus Magasanikbacteria bacterium]|nr:phosphatidylserine/phosphatidylglycerophosphate/cardiolipin synthase family protein [Candidatus Magasanikbacteria bacterium]
MNNEFTYKFYRHTTQAVSAMREAVLSAKSSIYWEIYTFIDDEFGQSFVDALCDKAQQGLEVKMIVDAVGSFDMSRNSIHRLRLAGVDLVFYNSLSPRHSLSTWMSRLWYRNHRKVLIIDKDIVFLGGVNVAKIYSQWDDLHVRLSGRPVNILLWSFATSYIHGGGDRKKVEHLLNLGIKNDIKEVRKRLKFILHSPIKFGDSSPKKFFLKSLETTKKKFNLMTPYFVPDKKFFNLISAAKERGAEVNLFLPGKTDYNFTDWIVSFYARLAHKSGANIFLSPKMNHGKAMTRDKEIGFVGSANLTPRSFFYNEEAGVLFEEKAMVEELDKIFEDLQKNSFQLSPEIISPLFLKTKIKSWFGKHMGGWI